MQIIRPKFWKLKNHYKEHLKDQNALFIRTQNQAQDRSSIHTVHQLSWEESSHSSSLDLRNENKEVSIAIVLACRKIESAYEAIRLLSDDIPADGSVRMVWKLLSKYIFISHIKLI